jgi:hypothetical protein
MNKLKEYFHLSIIFYFTFQVGDIQGQCSSLENVTSAMFRGRKNKKLFIQPYLSVVANTGSMFSCDAIALASESYP